MELLHRGVMAAVEQENEPASLAVYRHLAKLTPPPADLAELQDALTARAGFVRQWMQFFTQYPVVLLPVCGELPFDNEEDTKGFDRFRELLEAQLTQVGLPFIGVPALAITTGMAGDRPVGVQLAGPRYREDALLAAGEAITGGGAIPAIDPNWS